MNPTNRPIGAVLMAGGLGSRMGALTDSTPKPLLPVGATGNTIIDYALGAVQQSGVLPKDTVVCAARKGEQIREHLKGTGHTVIVGSNDGIAGDLLSALDQCPATFMALSCDLYPATFLKRLQGLHCAPGAGATLAFARVADTQWSQKHWRYGVQGSHLVSLDRQETTTDFEKAGLILERDAVVSISEQVKAILSTKKDMRGRAAMFGDGWHLLLHCLLEAGISVTAVELDECPCLNLNRPEHLEHAEGFVKKWQMNPLHRTEEV